MTAPSRLDSLFPRYDAREWHEVIVRAPPARVYAALHTANLGGSPLVKALLVLRALPFVFSRRRMRPRPLRFATGVRSLIDGGFGLLADDSDREVILGIGGAFWRPRPHPYPLDESSLAAGPPPGSAHAVWSFRTWPGAGGSTLLSTETRVLAGDATSRRRFRFYWILVRPFSGLIRRQMLRAIRREAERAHASSSPG